VEIKLTADTTDKKKVNATLAAMIWVAIWTAVNYFCGLGLSAWWLLAPLWMAPVGVVLIMAGLGYLSFIRDVMDLAFFRWFRK